MIKHRLIIVYGASPGTGKSTLSSRLRQALADDGQPVQWLYEDDVLHVDYFAPVMTYMRGEGALEMPDACLAATANLIAACAEGDTIVISDSILPYYDWLFAADYAYPAVSTFSATLYELLRPLHPLVVYLQANVEIALTRAVAQRGAAWLHDNIAFMNTWVANQSQPISDLASAIAYIRRADERKVQLFSEWPGDVFWLDSMVHSAAACVSTLLTYLGLTPVISQDHRSPLDLQHYVGHYAACDDEPLDNQQNLIITLVEGKLWIDHYWPNGCRLVAKNPRDFQLEDTSHWIEFVELDPKPGMQLCYHYRGKLYTYHKLVEHPD